MEHERYVGRRVSGSWRGRVVSITKYEERTSMSVHVLAPYTQSFKALPLWTVFSSHVS